MDFKQLEAFVCVAKHKSFSKAASYLFLTQPTVSSHIQKLEKELNTTLFDRNNKIVTLTSSGRILYNNAIIILNNCKKALYDLDEYSNKIEGCINIAASSIPETYILPSFINHFNKIYPDVKFHISYYNSKDAISEILDERVSFGFVGCNPNNSNINCIDLVEDELVLICSNDLDIPNSDGYIDLSQLTNIKFIMRKDGSGSKDLMLNTLHSHDFDINNLDIVANVESNEAIKEMVRLGIGCSFISYRSAIDYINNNKIKAYRIKQVDFNRNFYFIYSSKKILSPLENKFLDSIFEYFSK